LISIVHVIFRTDLLREKFERYGEIGDVYIPRDFHSHEPKGFAFVRFVNDREGEDALREMDGKEIDGRIIRIQEAKEKR
jgi:arginine/serine-rich splicing factor 2